MAAYLLGLVAVVIVYSLFAACIAGGRSEPPSPRRAIFAQNQQDHAGSEQGIKSEGDSPAKNSEATIPQSHANPKRDASGNQTNDGSNASSSRWRDNSTTNWILAIAAVIALGAAGFQVYYARTTVLTQQRAWVEISTPVVEVRPKSGHVMKAKAKLKNSGLTPAYVETYFVELTPGAKWHGFRSGTNLPSPLSPNPMIIPPGTERDILIWGVPTGFTEEDDKSELPVMVRVVVTYRDHFRKFHKTINCYVLSSTNHDLPLGEFTMDDCWKMD